MPSSCVHQQPTAEQGNQQHHTTSAVVRQAASHRPPPYVRLPCIRAHTQSDRRLLRGGPRQQHYYGSVHITQPTTLLVDSQCALDIAINSKISDRSKHIEVQHFFIRDHIEANTVKVQHTSSATQAADTLTKPLLRVAFKRCADMLGLSERQDKVKAQRVH